MKQTWQNLSDKVAALEPREKGIIFGGVMTLILWLNYMYSIEPIMIQKNKDESTITSQAEEIDSIQKQIGLYQGALGKDPNQAVNKSIIDTEKSIIEIDQTLSELTANFISPHKMREVLGELLRSDELIKVTNFTAIPAEKVDIAGVPSDTDITIYQHGIRLTITGTYFDLQRYVSRIEQLPWRFYWKTFAYTVVQHPTSQLEIEITTISTNEQFIAI